MSWVNLVSAILCLFLAVMTYIGKGYVIGTILLIIGLLFLGHSFGRKDENR